MAKEKRNAADFSQLVADLKSGGMAEHKERAAKLFAAAVAVSADLDDGQTPATKAMKAGAVAPLVTLVTNGTDGAQAHAASALARSPPPARAMPGPSLPPTRSRLW